MEKVAYQLESSPSENSRNGIASKKLHLIPLIFLIFFEVSGGPYGEEPAVAAAGPLFGILGFLIFPFIWSVPEALITAELATAFPGNGGFVIWADEAFGPFWGFQMGSLKFPSAVINNAAYPVNCVDYLKLVFKVFESGWPPKVTISVATLLLSFLNYTGLNIVGYTAVAFAVILLCPFILMALISAPKLHPLRWMSLGQKGVKRNWNLYFNTLFWNLNFWDNVSTVAGEVDRPQTNFPIALLSAVILASIGNLIPLFALTGSLTVDQNKWENGFFADAGGMVAGNWLKFWVELGMADMGFLPKVFALRSELFGTPWVGIMICSLITLIVSYMDFTDISSSANFLYSLGTLLEFASFIWLRRKYPNLNRPFKVPLGTPALVCMLLVPTGFLIFLIAIATKVVYVLSSLLILLGVFGYFLMKLCKARFWLDFTDKKQEALEEQEMTRLVPDKLEVS